jgi:hypothetical protein
MSLLDKLAPLPVAPEIRRGTGRPERYLTAEGKRVPSVTTILGRFKDSGGLIHWANTIGLEGITLAEARKAPLDAGSLVHRMIEADIHGTERPEVPEEYAEAVTNAYGAWREWMESYRMQVVATELALVSEEHLYAGTIDCVLRDSQGRLALGDWKAANAIYSDYLCQVAAYGLLWAENEDEALTGGFHIVRFSKTEGDMEHRYFPALDDALELFLLLRQAYDLDKIVAKRAK